MEATERTPRPLHSELAHDPDMIDLLESFVGQLPERARALRAAFDAKDEAQLRVLAHQLKGAAGSYGFAPISEASRLLEAAVAKRAPAVETLVLLARLADLCGRATHLPGR